MDAIISNNLFIPLSINTSCIYDTLSPECLQGHERSSRGEANAATHSPPVFRRGRWGGDCRHNWGGQPINTSESSATLSPECLQGHKLAHDLSPTPQLHSPPVFRRGRWGGDCRHNWGGQPINTSESSDTLSPECLQGHKLAHDLSPTPQRLHIPSHYRIRPHCSTPRNASTLLTFSHLHIKTLSILQPATDWHRN